jgi:predicted dithiol-disulfide oxidoreductase (DUF899 family)
MNSNIIEIEREIFELTAKLNELRGANEGVEVRNYAFDSLSGPTTLLDLFGHQKKLLLIHNMGQGCRYCTLWADGLNGFVPHIETAMALALVSKDKPEVQKTGPKCNVDSPIPAVGVSGLPLMVAVNISGNRQ